MIPYRGVIILRLFVTRYTRSLSLLRRLSWFLSRPLLLLCLKTYILPLFDYCDYVWSVCTKEESHRLETLLNFACRTVLYKRRDYSASSARKELGISTLSARRKIHLAQTIHKCVSSQSLLILATFFPLQPLTIILEHLQLLN